MSMKMEETEFVRNISI